MKIYKTALAIGIALLSAHTMAQTTVAGESYPQYYSSLQRIVLKDVMARFFNVNSKGILSYGLDDAAKASGHICPAVTGAYLMAQAGIDALAQSYRDQPSQYPVSSYDSEDNVIYRGGIKVSMSGAGNQGNAADAMADVISFITGAEGASGFKSGPDFPFANRQNLFVHDPNLKFDMKNGIEAIFTSMRAEYKDKDGKPATLQDCQGTWHQCTEITECDRSVKVSYRFDDPNIIGKDKTLPWDEKIKNILDHRDLAIKVTAVDNPQALCGK